MEAGQELPVGWAHTTLGEVAGKGQYGWTTRASSSGSIKFLRTTDITKGAVNWQSVPFCQENPPEPHKFYLSLGDIVVSRAGSVGFASLIDEIAESAVFASYLIRFSPDPCSTSPQYLNHFLHSPDYWEAISDAAAGIALANVNASKLSVISVPLAPLNEQRRIAAKLDTTLAAVDACRQRLDGVEALLKRFRQAVLAAATSGELTREWREERGEEESMKPVRLGDVIREMRNGLSPKPSLTPPGLRILRIGAIRPGSIDYEDCRYLELSPKDAEQYALLDGDLIFTRYNGTLEFVGVCALVQNVPGGYVYPDKLIRVRCDKGLALPAFVELAFGSANARAQIELLVKSSAGQKGVSGADLKGIRFGLPSIPEQEEIVRRAQQLFSLANQLEARLASARRIVERLTPALLAKAFRGELVPQDPGDEPASALLERIRAARQAEAAAAGPSRRGRRPAAANPVPSPGDAAPVPPDALAAILRECGALTERALLAASELAPQRFREQLALERDRGLVREGGEGVLEAALPGVTTM